MNNNVVFIITTYGTPDEHKKTLAFMNWVYSDNTTSFLESHGLIAHPLPMGKFRDPSPHGKGIAIKKAFEDAKLHLNNFNAKDIIIYMDGNQIDYQDSLKLIDLIKNKNKNYVTACRIKGMGIDAERGNIERFENFLISKRYGLPWIPDIQCGFWGFAGNYFEDLFISMESQSYEIELEVMNYFLLKGIYPAFVGMKIGVPEDTSFKPHHSEAKIIKLSKWLKFNKNKLEQLAEEYQKRYKQPLPIKYFSLFQLPQIYSQESINSIHPWNDWHGVTCVCNNCENEFSSVPDHPCMKNFDYQKHHTTNFFPFLHKN